jgi:hypothetical protein
MRSSGEGREHECSEERSERAAGALSQDGASLHLTMTVWANCEPKLLFGPS